MFITTYKVTAPTVIEEFIDTLEYDENSVLVHVDQYFCYTFTDHFNVILLIVKTTDMIAIVGSTW